MSHARLKIILPWLAALLVTFAAALQLHNQGRLWICSCNEFRIWLSHAWSSETSQQLFDPYSFTHLLHGVAFYGLLAWIMSKLAVRWRFVVAVLIEALWEIIENTNFVVQRYRETTAALGYQGDSVVNSIGDIVACAVGFWLARALGLVWSTVVFIVVEAVLLLVYRDSLILNILMLILPIDSIKNWQAGH
jgi:hypothetical protein